MKGKKSLAMPSESTSQMPYSDQDSWWKEWLKKRQTEHYIWGGKYSQVQVYYLFHDVNSFLRMKLKGNCELFGTDDVYIVCYKHFAMYIKKCLQTAYCVLCCDLMNKQIYPFFKVTTIKCFLILNKILSTDLS